MNIEISQYISSKARTEILLLLRSSFESNQKQGLALCETAFPKKFHCRKNVPLEQRAGYWRIVLEDEPSQIWAYRLDLSEHFFVDIPLETITSFFKGGFEVWARKLDLYEYPSQFQKFFSHIYTLDISENQIAELDVKQYGVYKIHANDNQITYLNASEINSSLTHLNLKNNHLQSISSDFWKNAQKIKHLDISGNQLEKLSLVLNWVYSPWRYTGRKEASLVSVDASYNQINVLEVSHHETGDSDYSKKKNVPVFYNFRRLVLHHNLLDSLPEVFFRTELMQNLQILDISHNQFKKLPQKIQLLPKLKRLNISHNQLEELVLPLEPTLQILLATHNFLEELPKNIGNLTSLEKIHLQHNKITELPVSLGNMKALRELRLHGNQLWYLPETFKNLQNLEYLSLGNNRFEEIPKDLFALIHLKSLDLSGNPLSIKEIEKLQKALPQTKITFKEN